MFEGRQGNVPLLHLDDGLAEDGYRKAPLRTGRAATAGGRPPPRRRATAPGRGNEGSWRQFRQPTFESRGTRVITSGHRQGFATQKRSVDLDKNESKLTLRNTNETS